MTSCFSPRATLRQAGRPLTHGLTQSTKYSSSEEFITEATVSMLVFLSEQSTLALVSLPRNLSSMEQTCISNQESSFRQQLDFLVAMASSGAPRTSVSPPKSPILTKIRPLLVTRDGLTTLTRRSKLSQPETSRVAALLLCTTLLPTHSLDQQNFL